MNNSFSIKEILESFPECKFKGNDATEIADIIRIDDATRNTNAPNSLCWVSDKNIHLIPDNLKVGLLILSEQTYSKLPNIKCNVLITETNPRAIFVKLVQLKFKEVREAKIEATAQIHSTAKLGENCYIGHHVIIEENCIIGNDTQILHNTCILAGTVIGNHVRIGCNNTIGNYGFGYEKDDDGDYMLLEHLGRVVISDDVEIHNNTCIDRGVIGDTIIKENVKIDNLVHIAHGVLIERNSLIIANAMVAGSCVVGENSWVAPSSSIKNKIKLAPNTLTGIGAVVLKDTEANSVVIGNPATSMEEYKRWSEVRKNLMKK